jgi:hypothetical protein
MVHSRRGVVLLLIAVVFSAILSLSGMCTSGNFYGFVSDDTGMEVLYFVAFFSSVGDSFSMFIFSTFAMKIPLYLPGEYFANGPVTMEYQMQSTFMPEVTFNITPIVRR